MLHAAVLARGERRSGGGAAAAVTGMISVLRGLVRFHSSDCGMCVGDQAVAKEGAIDVC